MNVPLLAVLPFSNADAHLAYAWLEWAKFLSTKEGGDMSNFKLLVCSRCNVKDPTWDHIRGLALQVPRFFETHYEGDLTNGVPEPGNRTEAGGQLFLSVFLYCEKHFPGHAILYCDADTVPIKPSWFHDIAAEYGRCPQPFMGEYVDGRLYGCPDHMAGGGSVYAANWRELMPMVIYDQNDTSLAREILPHFRQADTLQQIWRGDPFTEQNVKRIRPGTCLIHQCKDGSLIRLLRKRYE